MSDPAPRVAFLVFGCRLNQAEAERWREALARRGAPIVPPAEADVLCAHTCAVTAPAAIANRPMRTAKDVIGMANTVNKNTAMSAPHTAGTSFPHFSVRLTVCICPPYRLYASSSRTRWKSMA